MKRSKELSQISGNHAYCFDDKPKHMTLENIYMGEDQPAHLTPPYPLTQYDSTYDTHDTEHSRIKCETLSAVDRRK